MDTGITSACVQITEGDVGEEGETTVVRRASSRNRPESRAASMWRVLGKRVPREEIVFVSQMLVIFSVVVAAIYNLTVTSSRPNLWVALLSSSLGYVLPNPKLRGDRR